MKWILLLACSIFCSNTFVARAQHLASNQYNGFYAGVEAGAISYNTQITFDGVDDPAGRGGVGYGAFVGYKRTFAKLVAGAELVFNLASVPDPYTFDPAVTGFADFDLRRGASVGLDAKGGYMVMPKILLFGLVGYSWNHQSVRLDAVPLDQLEGGSDAKQFGAVQLGAGMIWAIRANLGFRFVFRTLHGYDLDIQDIPTEATLQRFDVEPSQQQFFFGFLYRFNT